MNTIKKKRLVILLLSVALAFSCIAVFTHNVKGSDGILQQEYELNSMIDIPDYAFGNILAKSVIYYPDGSAYSIKQAELSQHGKYTIVYSASVNGVYNEHKVNFIVNASAYSVSGKNSAATYGTNVLTPAVPGIQVSLTHSDDFFYNMVIDISNNTLNDDLLSMYIAPESVGNADFDTLEIKLTDVYDKDNYITVKVSRYSNENYSSYVLASPCGQTYAGKDPSSQKIWENSWGQYNFITFSGTPRSTLSQDLTDSMLRLRYDYATNCIYVVNLVSGNGHDPYWNFVADLDDGAYFDEHWEGFTTGEVYLSISCSDYTSSKASFAVIDINGQDLSVSSLKDDLPPSLEVDFDVYGEADLPVGVIGCEYTIFEAFAYDIFDGMTEVNTALYYNYGATSQISVQMTDGKFIPTRSGKYTIVYTAVDTSGNTTEKLVEIAIETQKEEYNFSVAAGNESDLKTGVAIKTRAYSLTRVSKYGEYSVQVTAINRSEEISVENDGSFIPMYEGEYTVLYVLSAFNGVTEKSSYTINVALNDKPVFLSEAELPSYFISGATYTLPDLYATEFSSGAAKEVKATITYFDTQLRNSTNNKITPVVAAGGGVTKIIYTVGAVTVEYPIITVNTKDSAGKLDDSQYFLSDGGVVTASSAGVIFNTKSDSSFSFINPIEIGESRLLLCVNPLKNNFSRLSIYLTDALDSENTIKVSLVKGNSSSIEETEQNFVVINDGMKRHIFNGSFYGYSTFDFSVNYSPALKQISDGVSTFLTVAKNLEGKPFNGFSNGLVFVRFEFEEVEGIAEASLKAIGSQRFTARGIDLVEPSVTLVGDYGGQYAIDSVVHIAAAFATDILDPNTTIAVTVRSPGSGSAAVSVDDVLLSGVPADRSYQLKVTAYGQYTVTYIASDSSGNTNYSKGYIIYVSDVNPPVITLSKEMPLSVKLGSKINIPKVTVADDVSESTTLIITCINPKNLTSTIKEGVVTFEFKGSYVLFFTAIDESGNATVMQFNIEVE